MKGSYFFLFLLLLIFSSCESMMYMVTGTIQDSSAKIFLPDQVIDLKKSVNYKDSILEISWKQAQGGMRFELRNISNYPLKLIWDEVTYIDYNGNSNNVLSGRINYYDKDLPMKPSIIPPGSYLSDIIIPVTGVHWTHNVKTGFHSWYTYGIANGKYTTEKRANEIGNLLKENGIGIMLPIDYKGQTRNYHFNFEVTKVKTERTY